MNSLMVTNLKVMVVHVSFINSDLSFKTGFCYSDLLRQFSCLATMV